jgi:alginate O-acetyltransferase complex protein AlgI
VLFNSIEFLIFFPVVTILYFVLPHKYRWFMLLVASCIFYAFFKAIYLLILVFTIIIDYYAGIWIEQAETKRKKKRFLVLSLIANIGVLAVFKYYNFLNSNIEGILSFFGYHNPVPYLKILLPIGLSFHTFQAMSYTIEIYRGNQKAEKHFGIYALYVMYYPQLVAGPIERPQNVLHQYHEKHSFDFDNVVKGLNMMAWGFFKKIVVADRLAVYVNEVYKDIPNATSASALIAVIFFSIQIYCDFSGYSNIAIGASKVMGIDLMANFDRPFLSRNITEFWRRWHISLSTWFNDYLYTPLAINMRNLGKLAIALALFITFFISGLWHGAGWTFIVYGCIHGIALIYEFLTKKLRKRAAKKIPSIIYDNVSILLTFCFVSFSWIFFRSPTFDHARAMLNKIGELHFSLTLTQLTAQKGPVNLIVSVLAIALAYIFSKSIPRDFRYKYDFMFLLVMTLMIIILSNNATGEFIYFQF